MGKALGGFNSIRTGRNCSADRLIEILASCRPLSQRLSLLKSTNVGPCLF